LARSAATVTCLRVAVVAGFCGGNSFVTARFGGAHRGSSGRAGEAGFDLAARGATVAVVGIAVVAGFAKRVVDGPIAAVRFEFAFLPDNRANVTTLDLAVGGTAVARRRIAVVAFFTGIDFGVPAIVHGQIASSALRRTGVSGLDVAARRVAAVAACGVAVVTSLVTGHDTIAANHCRATDFVRW